MKAPMGLAVLAVLAVSTSDQAAAAARTFGPWTVKVEKDRFSDARRAAAVLTGRRGALLALICEERGALPPLLTVRLSIGGAYDSGALYKVKFRADDRAVIAREAIGTRGYVEFGMGERVARDIMTARDVALRIEGDVESETAVLRVGKAGPVLKALSACLPDDAAIDRQLDAIIGNAPAPKRR